MSWDYQLDTASFRGVPFETQSLDDDLVRRWALYKYPYRDGADVDDLGREPRKTQLVAVFIGPSYESKLSAFMRVVDEGKVGPFKHPILGQWPARLSLSNIHHDGDHRDEATVQVDVIEDGTNRMLPELFSIEKLSEEVKARAEQVTAANDKRMAEVTRAVTATQDWADKAASKIDEATATVNEVRRTIDDALDKVRKLSDIESYPLVRLLKRMAYSCQKLSERAQRLHPVVLAKDISAAMPLPLLAHKLYGDHKRAAELVTLNTIRNPFLLPAGERLKVYGS